MGAARTFGAPPIYIGRFDISLPEVMYYLYLPVKMQGSLVRLPANVHCCAEIIDRAIIAAPRTYKFVYLSARKGWATPDNPLNRPGWHTDGFGTDDMNFVWWSGPGTRFAIQKFYCIANDDTRSLMQFGEQVDYNSVTSYAAKSLFMIDPFVVHATPVIEHPGCVRQYVKVSLSDHRYNLENNSHNYLFDYDWPMHSREMSRNTPAGAQEDAMP